MKTTMVRAGVVTLSLATFAATLAAASDSVVGTLTVKGRPTPLKSVAAALQSDPDDASRTWLVVLASDVPVAAADRTPARLAELAEGGTLKAVRFLWLEGTDTVFAAPYAAGLAQSGRRGLEHPSIDLTRLDDSRFEGTVKSKMMGQEWFFQAQVKADLTRGGTVELEPEAEAEEPSAGRGPASASTNAKLGLAKLGYEYTPEMLPHAIHDANVEAVKLFLAAGMSPNTTDPSADQPLARAVTECSYGHEAEATEMARALLAAGAKVDAGAKDGVTPLLTAAQHCSGVEIIDMLIAAGANVNTKAPGGATPLLFAKIFNKKDIEASLRRAGAHD